MSLHSSTTEHLTQSRSSSASRPSTANLPPELKLYIPCQRPAQLTDGSVTFRVHEPSRIRLSKHRSQYSFTPEFNSAARQQLGIDDRDTCQILTWRRAQLLVQTAVRTLYHSLPNKWCSSAPELRTKSDGSITFRRYSTCHAKSSALPPLQPIKKSQYLCILSFG